MRKPCSNSNLAQKNVPHSESFAVHALICKTLTNQGFADKKNSAFQQNCSKNGVPSLGAGDEESAEAPPAADEARRFRGSVPAVGCGSRRQPADTTVSAEAHTKKTPPVGWCFWSGRRGSLAALPRRDTHTGTKTCPRHVFLAALVPFRASSRGALFQKEYPILSVHVYRYTM